MRRTLIGAVATVALVAGSLSAAAAVVPIDGKHFDARGLTLADHGCYDTRAVAIYPAKFLIARGPKNPPIGQYASGWATTGGSYGAGVLAPLSDPSKLKTLRIKLYSPTADAVGVVEAIYHAPDDDGVWKGLATLDKDTTKGWHTVKATGATYDWVHFVGDTIDRSDPPATLPEMATRHGGDGDGAEVGFLFGCNEERFFVDDLEVKSHRVNKVYDFGGYRTLASLGIGKKERRSSTIAAGRSVALRNLLHRKTGGAPLAGRVAFESRPTTGGKWSRLTVRKGGKGGTKLTVRPHRSTSYRARFLGSGTLEPSTSRAVKVRVQKKVSSRFADASVTRGHTVTTSGQVLPAASGAVLLQRYLKGAWRTVKKGHRGGDGRFRLSFTATSLGKSYWRVLAPSGGGTVAGHSDTMRLTTGAPPPPPGGGGGEDPPPSDPPPSDPPPPSH